MFKLASESYNHWKDRQPNRVFFCLLRAKYKQVTSKAKDIMVDSLEEMMRRLLAHTAYVGEHRKRPPNDEIGMLSSD